MNTLPLEPSQGGGRYPHFDVSTQARHWDDATRAVVQGRLGRQPAIRFFTEKEEAAASALFDQLLSQRAEPRIPVVQMVDARLAENQTDGWHYRTMPPDAQAWRDSLAGLDADARTVHDVTFAECRWAQQTALLQAIQDLGTQRWHGMVAAQVWSLWTRYACTAFYSHPWAWNEIGFDGPAYPRGYKNLGLDKREPFEVADAHPRHDPVASRRASGDAR
ncbi:gluconate 2-dehydrogenase subunit 3 family protein [Microbacterium protaetiae]|uniref:Gluconate 2-dehydrogenase subunit 3 family protein n=1 Tax=Microbacterium protaetiae TaxID=2509458 RepID=A0A4P6ECN0_9MICO|nr:gluconate 2-dehydrogenase subunit 3 family protein [Microbacterium protaetiae]QAY59992.1 gluconate 2-dehydrogenase subunit 3 family protein [Microbacterium protaetiae]